MVKQVLRRVNKTVLGEKFKAEEEDVVEWDRVKQAMEEAGVEVKEHEGEAVRVKYFEATQDGKVGF